MRSVASLVMWLLATSAFATDGIWTGCAGFREIDPKADDVTARYLRALFFYGAHKNTLGEDELRFLAAAKAPTNPFFDGMTGIHPAELFVYKRAFDELLKEGGIDWGRVQSAVVPLLAQKRANGERRDVARVSTDFGFAPRAIPNTLFDVTTYSGFTAIKSWPGGFAAYAEGFTPGESAHWHFRASPAGPFVSIGPGRLTHFFPRANASPLVVIAGGGEVKVVDGVTGTALHTTHDNGATAFLLEPRPGKIVLFTESGWALIPHGALQKLPAFPTTMRFIRAGDGKRAFAYGIVDGEARVYDAVNGKLVHALKFAGGKVEGDPHMISNAKGELFLVARGEKATQGFAFASGQIHTFKHPPVGMVPAEPPFLEDGAGRVAFAFASNAHTVTMLDLNGGGEVTHRLPVAYADRKAPMHFVRLADGRRVVLASQAGNLQVADFDGHTVTKYKAPKMNGYVELPDGRLVGISDRTSDHDAVSPFGQTMREAALETTEVYGPRR